MRGSTDIFDVYILHLLGLHHPRPRPFLTIIFNHIAREGENEIIELVKYASKDIFIVTLD